MDICCVVGRDRNGWAVRSKAALLLTLVAKRQGPSLVKELLPQLLTIAAESPTHTEMVGRLTCELEINYIITTTTNGTRGSLFLKAQ